MGPPTEVPGGGAATAAVGPEAAHRGALEGARNREGTGAPLEPAATHGASGGMGLRRGV